MKLKVFDRILLALLLICAILVSFVLFGVAANVIRQDMTVDFINLFYAFTQNRLILAGCGLVLLLISLKLLFAGRGSKHETAPASTVMQKNEMGGTFISLSAIDSMVQKHCRALDRVKDCHSTLRAADDGVTIGIRLSVLPDTDVASLTGGLQQSLKAYIQSLTGIEVKEIGILVENADVPGDALQA